MTCPLQKQPRGFAHAPEVSPAPTERCHPLLRVLRMLLVEAHRYHNSVCATDTKFAAHNSLSIKALFRQLDYLWEELEAEPGEKYEFLRNRLSLAFLWNTENSHNITRCMINPPVQMTTMFRRNRQRLISALPLGELFEGGGAHHSNYTNHIPRF